MNDFEIDVSALSARRVYSLLTSLVVPRPIAWVATVDTAGRSNLAPHSYFNMVSSEPPIVHFTSSRRRGLVKDSARNARDTGEFVVNVVSAPLVEAMNLTSAELPHGEDEFAWAGIEACESRTVRPQRVARAPAALECKVVRILEIGNGTMVFGQVQWIHIASAVFDGHRVDAKALEPMARLGGPLYTPIAEPFTLQRPGPPATETP
ncbi:flavin reductase family protein [Actinomadura rugatobispora]|uniref:Flavin reductase family protein n=1 Tax=Actinomadura rugatobispora TaxID=1994 RepID=A0ABW0ZUF3_9ACTN|nr:flavin reductase family protein [Actinomadura rugatobispora]